MARTAVPASWHERLHVACEDPLVSVDLRPGADFSFEGAWVEIPPTRVVISSQGLRDEELAEPKPEGVRRLLCLGDSWTFGWGVELEDSFCSRLDVLLGDGWETVNLGVPGQNSSQEVRRLELHGLRFEPDVVLVQHEAGDLEPPLDNSHLGTFAGFVASRLALFRVILRARHSGQAAQVEPVSGEDGSPADPWDGLADSSAALSRLAELGRERGFRSVVFTDAPQLTGLMQQLEADGIAHASLSPALDGPEEELLIPGDEHWTAEGHRRVAELMAAELRARGLAH